MLELSDVRASTDSTGIAVSFKRAIYSSPQVCCSETQNMVVAVENIRGIGRSWFVGEEKESTGNANAGRFRELIDVQPRLMICY